MDTLQIFATSAATAIISIVGSVMTFLFSTSKKIDDHKLHVAENYVKKEEAAKIWEKTDGMHEKISKIESTLAGITASQNHQTNLIERVLERIDKH
jgi:hypothetical protein